MFKNYVIKKFDFITLILVILIAIIGIVLIDSATGNFTYYRDRQIIGLASGFVLMMICSLFDYHWYKKLVIPIFVANMGLLSAVLVFGKVSHEAKRWLVIGLFKLQPSEFTKLFLIIILAVYFSYFKDKINNIFVIIGGLLITLSSVGLILKQPDLSTSLMLIVLFVCIIYIANISYYYILAAFGVAVPSLYLFLRYIQRPEQTLLKDYQRNRIMAIIRPDLVPEGLTDQTNYSIMAIASGQAVGKGLGNAKVIGYGYLPEAHTDFIFASMGEEFGFFGSLLLLLLVLLLISRLIYVGRSSSDMMGKLIVAGVASLIAFQTFINVAVASGMLPNTGLTFPFVSYGMSSLWTNMIAVGIVLNVSLQPKKSQSELSISGVNVLRKEVVR